MNVSSVNPAGGLLGAASQSFATVYMRGSHSTAEFLTNSDIAMIKAATKIDFNWPPTVGEGAPQAAFDLSMVRLRQMQQGSVIADFTAQDLTALRRAGIIDADFLSNALEYLDGRGQDGSTFRSASSKASAESLAPKPGTVTQDGYMFL